MSPRPSRTLGAVALHGVLVLDKPRNLSSAAVVAQVKDLLRVDRIGHTGTLDPLATGVLPLCLGEGCKLAGHLLAEDKAYEAELELGIETDTLDAEGDVTARDAEAAAAVDVAILTAALAGFLGPGTQIPPMFSAIKQGGKRLHELARAGAEVERAPRPVVIHRLELLGFTPAFRDPPRVRIAVSCSKGTYVRSLVADLGRALGCGAHLTGLRRTRSGAFSIDQAEPLATLDLERARAALIAPSRILGLPCVAVPADRLRDVVDGKSLGWADLAAAQPEAERVQLLTPEGALLAVAAVRADRILLERVFMYGLTPGPASSNLQRSNS